MVQLATYLNDHMSGSTAVRELLKRLEQVRPSSDSDFLCDDSGQPTELLG